jgi:catalase
LQGRLFAYGDAQRYRLGVNYNQIPVNRPHCMVNDNSRDGYMRTDGNYGGDRGYTPNSAGQWYSSPEVAEPPLPLRARLGATIRKTIRPTIPSSKGQTLSPHERREESSLDRQHGSGDDGCPREHQVSPCDPLLFSGSGLWRKDRQSLGLDLKKVQEYAKLSNKELNKVTADKL